MILEFKTKRNINGHRNYIIIYTDTKEFCLESSTMIIYGIEIKVSDYRDIIKTLKDNGYTQIHLH